MANRYYVNGTGNTNDTFHWSLTSGGVGGASIPTSIDNVFFDNGSSAGSYVVTLNAIFNCLDLNFTNTKTCTFNSSVYSANIYGSLTLWAGLTWGFTGTAFVYLKNTSDIFVTANSALFNCNTLNMDGYGSVTHIDNIVFGGTIKINNGIWNTNNKNIDIQTIWRSGSLPTTINLGSSIINTYGWSIGNVPIGLTFNCGTSTIIIGAPKMYSANFIYYNITASSDLIISADNLNFILNVTGILTINGLNSYTRKILKSDSIVGKQLILTIPSNNIIVSNINIKDVNFTNPVDLSNIVGGSQDFGNNTNVTFTPGIDCYYKGTTGAHNWSVNWVKTDRVTAARVPLIQDNARFDNLSFTGVAILNLDIAVTCKNIDFTGIDKALTLSSAVNSLSIYGDTILVPNLIWTFTGTAYTYMKGLGSLNITTNGVIPSMNKLYFDRVGGTWTNQDNFNIGSVYIGLTNGTWNTNGKTISTTGIFETLTGTKVLTCGSSIINFGTLKDTITLGLTINPNTSTVIISTTATLSTNSSNYYNLTIQGAIVLVSLVANVVVNTLNLIGVNNTTSRLLIASSTIGTSISITSTNNNITNTDFRDIKGLGTANWNLSAIPGGSGDCGGNSNIIFTPSVTQYYKHTSGACNWSDAKWYSDITPRTTVGRVPLPQDDAIFDGNSFTGASTLTVNVPRICRNLDMSGVNQTVTVNNASNIECYGDFILSSNITLLGGGRLYLYGLVNNILKIYNSCNQIFTVGRLNSNYTLANDLITTMIFGIGATNGVFDLNDFNVITPYFSFNAGSLYLGNGLITINGNTTNTFTFTATNLYSEGSTIKLNPATVTSDIVLTLASGLVFNKLQLSGTHTGNFNIQGSNTYNELIIDAGRKIRFSAGTTTTIGKLTAIGTQAQPITIDSVTAATHNLVKTGTDVVEVEYCNISNSNATPIDKWSAGETSIDGGGNSGWTFKFVPIVMWFFAIIRKVIK